MFYGTLDTVIYSSSLRQVRVYLGETCQERATEPGSVVKTRATEPGNVTNGNTFDVDRQDVPPSL
jgi:hypothetical protein